MMDLAAWIVVILTIAASFFGYWVANAEKKKSATN